MSTVTIINSPVVQRVSITADSIASVVEITPNYTTRRVAIVVRAPGLGTKKTILKADRGDEGDPVSGQNIVYLPADKDYLIFQNTTVLYEGDDYTRDGAVVTLLTGDILPDDKFLLCE